MKTPLFQSRSFWTVIIEFVISIVLYFVGKYLGEPYATDVKFLIGASLPLAGLLVAAFTVDDVSARNAQVRLEESRLYAKFGTDECCEDKDCCK